MSQRVIAGPPVSMQAWITRADCSCAATLALVTVKRKTAVPAAASKRNIIVPPFKRSLPDLRRLIYATLSGGATDLKSDYWVSCPLTPHVSDSR
jgi:hypothetical protein